MSNLPENQIIPKQLFYEKFYKMSFFNYMNKIGLVFSFRKKTNYCSSFLKYPGEIKGA